MVDYFSQTEILWSVSFRQSLFFFREHDSMIFNDFKVVYFFDVQNELKLYGIECGEG